MGAGIAITRLDLTASELRAAARRAQDVAAARRMLCLAMVLDGADRATAAEACGMDRQTLRDWVHRYNAEGLHGLYDRRRPGPRPKLSAEQMQELANLARSAVRSSPAPTPPSSSMAPAITSPMISSSQTTSRSSACRHTHPN